MSDQGQTSAVGERFLMECVCILPLPKEVAFAQVLIPPHLPMGHPDDKKLRAAVRRNLYYEGYIPVNFL